MPLRKKCKLILTISVCLSVIILGQDKGKSYIKHQAAQNGTSYKAKLKAAIDRLMPACSDLEELLRRLQREGYEIKRGKYISARAPDQERFTWCGLHRRSPCRSDCRTLQTFPPAETAEREDQPAH